MAGRITIDNLSESLKEHLNALGLTEEQIQQMLESTLNINSLVTNDKTIVGAINEVFQSGNNAKQNLVEALIAHGITNVSTSMSWSEINTIITNSNVGLTEEQVQAMIDAMVNEEIGDKNNLLTEDKSNLVAAINEVFQSGNNAKQELVAALVAKGLEATTDMSFKELITYIDNLISAQGTAVASDVLSGKTFINSTGEIIKGSIPNKGTVKITPSTKDVVYTNAYFTKLTVASTWTYSGNIKAGVTIFGITGDY